MATEVARGGNTANRSAAATNEARVTAIGLKRQLFSTLVVAASTVVHVLGLVVRVLAEPAVHPGFRLASTPRFPHFFSGLTSYFLDENSG